MPPLNSSAHDPSFFSVPQAKWVICVLNMVIAVVRTESLLGLILRQTRSEITSLVRDEETDVTKARAACFRNN
jgi:hypothetical protein